MRPSIEKEKGEEGGKKEKNGSGKRGSRSIGGWVFDLDKYIFRYTDDATGIEFR